MAIPRAPLLSLKAQGSIGKEITYQKRGRGTFARQMPVPKDPYTLGQAYQRWLYQDYCAYWKTLAQATKDQWETDARPEHMTGFAFWMRTQLNTLPDIAAGYRLDIIKGNTVIDFSKNGNTGTVFGATLAPGHIKNALNFDGVDDYVNCGQDPSLNITQNISVEFWIKPRLNWPHGFALGYAFSKGDAVGRGYSSYLTKPGTIFWVFRDGGVEKAVAVSITPNTWSHFLGTYDGLQSILYLNGVAGAPLNYVGDIDASPTDNLFIATDGAGRLNDTIIDHLVIRNRVLTAADAKRHSERGYPS